jgi:dTDP-4-amino-4,6-dideoxygalactose transaminase
VIEDAAQSFGADYGRRKAGTIGELGCFSFFPTKTIGGFGDGGLVTTEDGELATRLRMLRNHGGTSKFENVLVGTNSRLDALQAALLRVRLAHIDEILAGRGRVAGLYDDRLVEADVGLPVRASGRTHVFAFYVVRAHNRDAVLSRLTAEGIGATVHNPSPVHLQPAVNLGYLSGDLPEAEAACSEVISLPTFPAIRTDEIDAVVAAVKAAVGPAAASEAKVR